MPVLHLLAGPNGSGKTTFSEHVLGPATRLRFINADVVARETWPGEEQERAYEAAAIAAEQRAAAIAEGRSFATETVFSHPSKLELVQQAKAAGYQTVLHVMIVPEDLAVVRARLRGRQGGHSVPAVKVRRRFRRLWKLVARAIEIAEETIVYDNSRAGRPFAVVAHYHRGKLCGEPRWPSWSPLPPSRR